VTIPFALFAPLILVSVAAAAVTPVLLIVLFLRDRKKGSPW
jgi:hypothetical protein